MGLYVVFLLCFIFLIGGFIQGASSFGLGLFVVGFLSLFFSVKDSTLIIIALITLSSASIAFQKRRSIRIRQLYGVMAVAMMGRLLSFWFLDAFGETLWAKKLLGIVLIGMVVYFVVKPKRISEPDAETVSTTRKKQSYLFYTLMGLLGGFVGGAFGVGGPFFVLLFLVWFRDKHEYLANLHFTAVFLNFVTLTLHGVNGDFSWTMLQYVALGGVAVVLGSLIGLKCYNRLPRIWIQRICYVIVVLAGLSMFGINM